MIPIKTMQQKKNTQLPHRTVKSDLVYWLFYFQNSSSWGVGKANNQVNKNSEHDSHQRARKRKAEERKRRRITSANRKWETEAVGLGWKRSLGMVDKISINTELNAFLLPVNVLLTTYLLPYLLPWHEVHQKRNSETSSAAVKNVPT